MTRILLADANVDVRIALRLVIEQQEGIELIGEASDAINLFAQVANHCPDLALIDAELPGLQFHRSGVNSPLAELISALRVLCPTLRVIALSSQPPVEKLCQLAKADAFICKSDPPDTLLALLETILKLKEQEC